MRAQALAEEARLDVAKRLTGVDSKQRYSFLEATVSAMDAHVRYYQRSMEVMAGRRMPRQRPPLGQRSEAAARARR